MRRTVLSSLFLCALSTLASAQATNSSGDTQTTAVTPATASTPQADTTTPPKKKVKHVYTSDDLKPADPNDISSPGGNASAAAGNTTTAATSGDAAKSDKAAKSKKADKKPDAEAIATQQAKVDELKKQVDGTSHVVADIQRLIDEQPSRAAGMGAGLVKQQSDLADLKKQLDAAQSQLDSMKEPK